MHPISRDDLHLAVEHVTGGQVHGAVAYVDRLSGSILWAALSTVRPRSILALTLRLRLLALNAVMVLMAGVFFNACTGSGDGVGQKTVLIEPVDSLGFAGEWFSVKRPYPHGSSLIIDKSGIFEYHVGACAYHARGKGKLHLLNDTLVLLSDSIHGCSMLDDFDLWIHPFGSDMVEIWKEQPGRWSMTDTCQQQDWENSTVIFNEEHFVIEQDTLRHLSRHSVVDPRFANHFVRSKAGSFPN